jgi:hypothetical protein
VLNFAVGPPGVLNFAVGLTIHLAMTSSYNGLVALACALGAHARPDLNARRYAIKVRVADRPRTVPINSSPRQAVSAARTR